MLRHGRLAASGRNGSRLLAAGFMVLALSATADLRALDPSRTVDQYTQRRWSVDEGLPQVSINSIVQDQDGYLWIGTFGGLVRFDGVKVEVIDPGGSCSSRILSLEVDDAGTLWVGSERSGLCRYHDGKLVPVAPPDGSDLGGVAQIETSSSGRIRAATARGLITLGEAGFSRVSVADGLPHENVVSIAEHPDGSVWVGTRTGMCILRESHCEVPSWSAPFADGMVSAIHHSDFGASWVGTDRGLWWIREGQIERVFADPAGGKVRAISEDRDGGLWIGLEPGGLRRILPSVESLTGIDPNTNDTVNEIFEDREGNLWIGLAGDGLLRLAHGAALGVRVHGEDEKTLPVLPILAEGGGRAWVGTICRGLVHIEPGGVRFFGEPEGLAEVCIWSLLRDRRGTIWIGSYGDGLYWMDEDSSIHRVGGPPTFEGLVRAMAEAEDGRILVGTDEGLFHYDPVQGSFDLVQGTEKLDVFFVGVWGDDTWVGSRQGAWLLRGGDALEAVGTEQGLAHDFVRAVHVDTSGVVWFGTYGGGLSRKEGDQLVTFGPEHGLPDPTVSSIVEDEEGRFWMSGNQGVTRVARAALDSVARGERESVVANLYDATDGMPSTETNGGGQPAASLDRDGKIWFPTVSGLAVFDSRRESFNLVPPPVRIEKVLLDGLPVDTDGGPLLLPSNARNLEIHYTGLSFNAPEKVRFRYRLMGFDERWVEAGDRRVAYYPAIPPGELRFRVVAANEDGVWNQDGAEFAFEMRPRFIDTWPFYALCVLVLSLVWIVVLRIRTAAGVRREQDLQLEVESRTAELARLAKLTEVINEAVTIEEVLDRLYDDLRPTIPYDRIGLALLDEDQLVLRSVWSRGDVEPVGIGRGYEAPLEGSSLQRVLESGRPRIIGDLERYVAEHPESLSSRQILSEGIRSSLTCPLKAVDRPVGFVFFSSRKPYTYNETHIEFLGHLAGHLSLIVGKSKLYEDLERANRELENLAAVDGLTGLANRRTFDEHLDQEWRRAVRAEMPIGLLMIDVDYFKRFNDRYGHGDGDAALKAVSRLLAENIRRAGDLAARYGGEEFAVILPGSDRAAATRMAEKLRTGIEEIAIPHESSGCGPVLTVSVGVAVALPTTDEGLLDLMASADAALYEAKEQGRNRVILFEGAGG